jgi:hypothetical protein
VKRNSFKKLGKFEKYTAVYGYLTYNSAPTPDVETD